MPVIRHNSGIVFTMSLRLRKKLPLSIIHKAGWVLVDPEHIIKNGFVKTDGGKITDIGQGRAYGSNDPVVDHGPGILMPCLVNAHTHLELSALKDKTDTVSGFIPWVRSVIEKREEVGEQNLLDGLVSGINAVADSGSLIAGDISSGLSRHAFLKSKLSGVWFKEYLGTGRQEEPECKKIKNDKMFSIAGHAPHTTGSDLLVKLKSICRGHDLPFSIHLAESKEEVEFLRTGKGAWADFLSQRNIDPSAIRVSGAGPVKYADQLGLFDGKTLAVHLVFADQEDIALLSAKNVNVCICPRSNQVLHQHLPDVPMMLRYGLKLCLGTDSLASNSTLSLFDEIKFLTRSFSEIAPSSFIAMATINGAAALGLEKHFGTLTPGKISKMIYLPVKGNSTNTILESIVSADFSGKIKGIY